LAVVRYAWCVPAPTSPRLILAIETSNPSTAVAGTAGGGQGVAVVRALGGTTDVLGVERLVEPGRHDDDLMPAIQRVMKRVGVAPRAITDVAVSVGPGGFTAVRIAVTTAKLIAEATGARCVAVPSAAVVARRVRNEGKPFAVALASKGETAFVTVFDGAARATGEGRLIGGADLAGLGVRLMAADQFLPAPIVSEARGLGIEILTPEFDPVACAEAALELEAVDPIDLAPLYPREPEAVRKWRELHGNRG
jgi:tRNA threonylcarbamoyl adenosine modification protein YeaZ